MGDMRKEHLQAVSLQSSLHSYTGLLKSRHDSGSPQIEAGFSVNGSSGQFPRPLPAPPGNLSKAVVVDATADPTFL